MFDTALLESGPGHRVWVNGAGLPLAAAAHLVLIGAFVGTSVWTVGEPAEPETRIEVFPTFVRLSAPPSPGGGHPGPAPHPPRSNVLTPPTTVPPDLPAPEQDALPPGPGEPGTTEANATGPEGGPGPGGGPGEVPGVGPEDPGETEAILRPGGDVTFPVLLTRVEPVYPETARRLHWEGTLILEAVITAAGDVQEVHVLKSLNPLLDTAAAQAVRQWRYRPAIRNGRAVPVYLTVTVRFSLND